MTKRNELLEKDISQQIEGVRYIEPKSEKPKRNWLYLILVFLVTLAVLFSLLRQF